MQNILKALMALENEQVEIVYMNGSAVKGTRYTLDPAKKLLILTLHDSNSYHIVQFDEIVKLTITPFKQEPVAYRRSSRR